MKLAIAILTLLFGCVSLEERAPAPARWSGDLDAVFARCRSCHLLPALADYRSLMGCRDDGEPWIFLLADALARDDHAEATDAAERARIVRWIQEGAVFFSARAHPAGFAVDHADEALEDLARCNGCHQRPVELGGAPACTTCHERSFTDDRCDACHGGDGDPRPRANACDTADERAAVGAHAFHVAPSRDPAYPAVGCATCHRVPDRLESEGHLADGSAGAEVRFDPERLARWDPATRTCIDVECHAGRAVGWSDRAVGPECERCHGAPPQGHASDRCSVCHAGARHLDGVLDVRSGCSDCHGAGESGAHAKHLAPGALAPSAGCADCHQVPGDRDDPGHIDSDLPAEVLFASERARGGGRANPRWDGAACADVGCHGGHLDGGAKTELEWSGGAIECGDCHALPPVRVAGERLHLPTGSAECGACHRTAAGEPITAGTSAITEAGRAAHADGCVDLEAGCAR